MNEKQTWLQEYRKKRIDNDGVDNVVQPMLLQSQLYLVQIAMVDLFRKYEDEPGASDILNSIDIIIEYCRAHETFII